MISRVREFRAMLRVVDGRNAGRPHFTMTELTPRDWLAAQSAAP
jgi:hypothetical protein